MPCDCNLRKRITRDKITLNKRDVYLDYNSTTKPNNRVLASIDQINRNYWGNPSAQNSRGVNLYNYINGEIHKAKLELGLNNMKIYFDTSSTSLIHKIGNIEKNVITSNIEHTSLLKVANNTVQVDNRGQLDLNKLESICKKQYPSLIVYSPVNHETGNIQPIAKIFEIAKRYNIKIILDAVQTINRLDREKWLPYCDGFYFSGHKIHGVQGAATLILKDSFINFNLDNSPLPFSLYSGTFNSPAVIGLLTATLDTLKSSKTVLNEIRVLQKEGINILAKCSKDIIFESDINNLTGVINISIPIVDKIEDLLMHLSIEGIQVGRLSACSGDINKKSYVLTAMGRDIKRASTSIRISFGRESKRDDFFRLSAALKSFISSNLP
ncbi:aminotransferase class V-fold PLP-dependent enzyme [Thiospirochaeta perfilievii]|uniref:Aminotransferase class V-fold PLP-dependent enzyme n=1 Tax=Thiospirochaeta perfilievii TaxID=252967 RepID=A0A5C1QC44_9SPIO|nr:aminotransferase class V-fold PLP-dependent enzyme [Thiospirochaeta perfilievii]QEN04244.1 aminotransferase class V-fold PLP-dependent enzyme [Thiospirochaeta perfilievii]